MSRLTRRILSAGLFAGGLFILLESRDQSALVSGLLEVAAMVAAFFAGFLRAGVRGDTVTH